MRRKIEYDPWYLKTCVVNIIHPFSSEVINHVDTEGCYIPYMTRQTGRNWVFPEEAEVQKTTLEQVCRDMPVAYNHSIRIRCNISQDTEEKIDDELTTIQGVYLDDSFLILFRFIT